MRQSEKIARQEIADAIRYEPIYVHWLSKIKGIGTCLAGGVISWFDPYKADTPSGFWRYAGLDVVKGKAPRRQKGVRTHFNPKLKTLCWKIARQFVLQGAFYRDLYDRFKDQLTERMGAYIDNPQLCPRYGECIEKLKARAERTKRKTKKVPCKAHINNMAMRKTVKVFVAHLWEKWREIENLPTRPPYAIEQLKHKSYLKPPQLDE